MAVDLTPRPTVATTPPPMCRVCGEPMPRKWPHTQHAQCWKQTNPTTTHTEEKTE